MDAFLIRKADIAGGGFFFLCLMASLIEVGKNIASDLDLVFWSPACIVRPNFLKWCRMVVAAFSRSSLFS